MDSEKRTRLEAAGFKVGSPAEFLGMTPAEQAIVEMRLALSKALRARRKDRKLSQLDLAKRLRSSQSRVARIEAGDPSVSLDLMLRALLETGASREDVAAAISSGVE